MPGRGGCPPTSSPVAAPSSSSGTRSTTSSAPTRWPRRVRMSEPSVTGDHRHDEPDRSGRRGDLGETGPEAERFPVLLLATGIAMLHRPHRGIEDHLDQI